MKKFVIATTIAALMSGVVMAPAAMAGPRDHRIEQRYDSRHNGHYDNRRWDNRHQNSHWKRGERVSRQYQHRRHVVNDYRRHNLSAPPRGHQWVQADNDFLLVAAATGIIASIIAASSR